MVAYPRGLISILTTNTNDATRKDDDDDKQASAKQAKDVSRQNMGRL